MIDTIHLFLPSEFIPDDYLLSRKSIFTNLDRKTSLSSGEIKFYGFFKNFRVKQSLKGIYVEGSLSKYFLGTNQKTLRQSDLTSAFTQLSEDLGLPINKSKVNRVDIAENIVTISPVNQYYDVLGRTKYFRRLELNQGLAYQNVNRAISLYDKNKETKRHKLG